MSDDTAVQDLEAALLERAKVLADECLTRAHQSRDRIIQEENERLRLQEEREVLAAKAMAERIYRRRVQASELRVQEQLDRVRWELTQAVMQGLTERLRAFAMDESTYLPVLQLFLAQAAQSIEAKELVAEVNARDLARIQSRKDEFVKETVPGKTIALHPEPRACTGGVLVRSKDNSVLVDNTFEGRIDRYKDDLHRVVIEHLFAQTVHMGELVRG
jgi:V/A-type H+-transporting ATPase subunit E